MLENPSPEFGAATSAIRPMRILVVHNTYQHRGGEDAVVDAEIALLQAFGHRVEVYRQHNEVLTQMPRAVAAASAVWSLRSAREVNRVCQHFMPDLLHAHNTFPLISPSLYWVAAKKNIPVVQTLHNFRLLCPQAIFLREGKICEDCIGRLPWRAVTRKCYRESATQSAVLASMLTAHRALGTYRQRVTRYIALNTFARDKYIAGGLPAALFRIKPNFVRSNGTPAWNGRHGGLYVGRLSPEKGLEVLADAARLAPGAQIEVIGSGPLQTLAINVFGNRYLGFLPLEDILQRMQSAQFLILPSICYENSPRTIVEAFASGLPVIASRLGALIDIVRDGVTGLLFEPGNAADLAAKIAWAQAHPQQMMCMGQAARAEYEALYTPERNHEMLMNIYEDALASLHKKCHAA